MQKMSVTRALVEMKRFTDRINQAIANGTFVSVAVGQDSVRKVPHSNKTVAEMVSDIQSSFDKVESLIANRAKLKASIVLSNATTQVTILGRTMSVAEAIELKSTVAQRESLLQTLSGKFVAAQRIVELKNDELAKKIDALMTTSFGSDKREVSKEMFDMISAPQKRNGEYSLIDPLNIQAKIDKVREEISQLSSELDFVLSESNARTELEVDI